MLDNSSDWRVESDIRSQLVFVTDITLTAQRLDFIIWSVRHTKEGFRHGADSTF